MLPIGPPRCCIAIRCHRESIQSPTQHVHEVSTVDSLRGEGSKHPITLRSIQTEPFNTKPQLKGHACHSMHKDAFMLQMQSAWEWFEWHDDGDYGMNSFHIWTGVCSPCSDRHRQVADIISTALLFIFLSGQSPGQQQRHTHEKKNNLYDDRMLGHEMHFHHRLCTQETHCGVVSRGVAINVMSILRGHEDFFSLKTCEHTVFVWVN